jgi:hypothetical protein
MNFALLWTDALLVLLLWVSAGAAVVGRIRFRWLRAILMLGVFCISCVVLGGFTFLTGGMKFNMRIEPNWFGYALSLLLTHIVGALVVLYRSRRRAPGMAPAAANWPRGPLLFALVMAMAVGYMTLLNMDLMIRARCAIQSVEVNSRYLATLPAITSDSQNAAPLYEQAFSRLADAQAQEAEINNTPTGNSDDFDPNEPATIKFLSDQAGTIALLRRAAALAACRFDRDLVDADIDQKRMSGLNAERNAANVLNLDAREELARGRVAHAVADADAIISMGRQFGDRPLLISSLVAMGIDAIGNSTLELALPAVKNRDELAELHLEQRSFFGRRFKQAMCGEESYGLAIYGNMPAGEDPMAFDRQAPDAQILSMSTGTVGALFRVFFLDSDAYVSLMEQIQMLATQPYYQVRQQLNDIFTAQSHRGLLSSILIPALSKSFETAARIEAGDACAQVAVAMTHYRLDHGNLPAHLADLVPAYLDTIPLDPFDGQPLRLVIRNNQWIIYSVGPDLKDNGGIANENRSGGNVIFTLKAKPEPATKPSP